MKILALIGAAVLNMIAVAVCCIIAVSHFEEDIMLPLILGEILIYGVVMGLLRRLYTKKLGISSKAFRLGANIPIIAIVAVSMLILLYNYSISTGYQAMGCFLVMMITGVATAIFLAAVFGIDIAVNKLIDRNAEYKRKRAEFYATQEDKK